MEETVKERLKLYLKENNISQTSFCAAIGVGTGYISSMRVSIQPDKLHRIAINYPKLNLGWLLTGVGKKGIENSEITTEFEEKNIDYKEKYYSALETLTKAQAEIIKLQKEIDRIRDEGRGRVANGA